MVREGNRVVSIIPRSLSGYLGQTQGRSRNCHRSSQLHRKGASEMGTASAWNRWRTARHNCHERLPQRNRSAASRADSGRRKAATPVLAAYEADPSLLGQRFWFKIKVASLIFGNAALNQGAGAARACPCRASEAMRAGRNRRFGETAYVRNVPDRERLALAART